MKVPSFVTFNIVLKPHKHDEIHRTALRSAKQWQKQCYVAHSGPASEFVHCDSKLAQVDQRASNEYSIGVSSC